MGARQTSLLRLPRAYTDIIFRSEAVPAGAPRAAAPAARRAAPPPPVLEPPASGSRAKPPKSVAKAAAAAARAAAAAKAKAEEEDEEEEEEEAAAAAEGSEEEAAPPPPPPPPPPPKKKPAAAAEPAAPPKKISRRFLGKEKGQEPNPEGFELQRKSKRTPGSAGVAIPPPPAAEPPPPPEAPLPRLDITPLPPRAALPKLFKSEADIPEFCEGGERFPEEEVEFHLVEADEVDADAHPCHLANITHWALKYWYSLGTVKICTHDPKVDEVISDHLHKWSFWGSPDEWMVLLAAGPCTAERPYMLDIGSNLGVFSLIGPLSPSARTSTACTSPSRPTATRTASCWRSTPWESTLRRSAWASAPPTRAPRASTWAAQSRRA
jgi:hypothetical protein